VTPSLLHDQPPLEFILHVDPPKECVVVGGGGGSGTSTCGSATPDGSLPTVTKDNNNNNNNNNNDDDDDDNERFLRIHPNLRKISKHHLATIPNDTNGREPWDDGILIRASVHSKLLHRAMPFAFPVVQQQRGAGPMMGRNRSESGGNGAALDDSSITPVQKLVSCTSVLLLNGHSEEKNKEETVSREDTGGDIYTTRSWYLQPFIERVPFGSRPKNAHSRR